jgi:hypothetical protein
MAEKKGLFYKLIVGKDRDENYARSTLPGNRWELFWDVFKGRFWKLVLLNLMLIVGFLPLLFVLFNKSYLISFFSSMLPISGSAFVGYPYIPDLHAVAFINIISLEAQSFALLIPCLMFAGVVMSGVFYIARNLAWNEGVFMANDFWKGLKSNILHFLLITFLMGVLYLSSSLSNLVLEKAPILTPGALIANPTFNAIIRGLNIVLMVFITIMAMYAFTITVNYKLKFRHLIKNSFILTLGLLPQNLFFLALSALPFIFIAIFGFNSFLSSLMLIIILLFGFSLVALVWTIYSHWVFDRFINDKVEGAIKNRGIYEKVSRDGKPVAKGKQKAYFKNPKKKKAKPITDDEIQLTELPTMFTRKDLEKLAKEKEFIKQDSERWAKEHENDDLEEEEQAEGEGMDAYEGFEDAMRLEGYDEEIEQEIKKAIKEQKGGEGQGEEQKKE